MEWKKFLKKYTEHLISNISHTHTQHLFLQINLRGPRSDAVMY